MRNSVEGIASIDIPSAQAAQLRLLTEAVDQLHWASADDMRARQAAQLTNTVRWHAHTNQAFMQRLRAAGMRDDGIGHEWLQALPPLTRRAWQDAGTAMFNDSVPRSHGQLQEGSTSGSTGEPVKVKRTSLNGSLWAAHTLLDHDWHHRDFRGKLMAVRGDIHERQQGHDWGFPVAMVTETGPGLGLPITTDVAELLGEIERFQPTTLVIYPSMLRPCLDAWASSTAKPVSIEHVKTIGETVSDELRQQVEAVLHLRIEDTYSSNEFGTIAASCQHGQYHTMLESVIVEVLDDQGNACAPGEIGRLVITDLLNWATPIIRYDIGDWGIAGDRCSCGRRSPTLAKVMGRTRNLIVHPDGRRNWPLTGFKGFSDIAPIRQYQVIQHAIDDVELRIACDEELTLDQSDRLTALVQRFLGGTFPLRITRQAGALALARNGKHEEFICEVI